MKPAVVSADEGSDGLLSAMVMGLPSSTGSVAEKVAVGFALLITPVTVYSFDPPSLSLMVARMVRDPLSVVAQVVDAAEAKAP